MSELDSKLAQKRDRLVAALAELDACLVAYSGGVDSAVVAKAAHLALGPRAVAVTAVSPSLAAGELEAARELAARIGIEHRVVQTGEFAVDGYTRNDSDRCFFCKSELYTRLEQLAPALGAKVLVNGANADDRGDHRPGMLAARDFSVRSPLAECGMTKVEVRQLAAWWQLPVWDKPASPCLSSRIAYGEEVTPQRVEMIDRAEQFLRSLGLGELRVRYHRGDLARIEVPIAALPELCRDDVRRRLVLRLGELGFKFVTLDLEGFRSGSLNQLVPPESLRILGG